MHRYLASVILLTAAMVEQRFGRQALLECMMDPRKLLTMYVAEEATAKGATLRTWSPQFLARLSAR